MKSSEIRFKHTIEKIPSNANSVLDIGCVRHNEAKRREANLHDAISSHVDGELIGIDIDETEIKKMRNEGYNVQVGNAEELRFDRKFNVIVAGEVIEHLSNPGIFLNKASKILTSDGKIILTTPNPDGFAYFRKALLNQENNPTHTCWIDPDNLSVLVDKTDGLEFESYKYLPPVGGISMVLWKVGQRRAASPGYIAVLIESGPD